MKRVLAVSICIMMLASLSLSVYATDKPKGEIVDGVFRYFEPVEIEAMVRYSPDSVSDPSKEWIFEWARQKMNINFIIEGVTNESESEKTPLLFAANDLPEVLFNWVSLNNLSLQAMYGDVEKQLKPTQGLITPEIMPNLYKNLEEMPVVKAFCSTFEGNMYNFPRFFAKTNLSSPPFWYYPPAFEAVGFSEPPKTTDELLTALRAIKENDPLNAGKDLVPMGTGNEVADPSPILLNAFGLNATSRNWNLLALKNGDFESGDLVSLHTDPAYYEYLKYMNTMYNEGLIDPDYYTIDSKQLAAKMSSGYYAIVPTYDVYNMPPDNWSEWRIMEPLTSPISDQKMVSYGAYYGGPVYYAFITNACSDEKAEAIARFMDNGYDKEKGYLFYHGPQAGVDETFGLVEGWVKAEDKISYVFKDVQSGKFDKDSSYRAFIGPFSPTGNVFDRRNGMADISMYTDETQIGLRMLETTQKSFPYVIYSYRGAKFDAETTLRLSDLEGLLQDHADKEEAKFITNARPITQVEFDKFVEEMKALGLDEFMDLQLKAFQEQYR